MATPYMTDPFQPGAETIGNVLPPTPPGTPTYPINPNSIAQQRMQAQVGGVGVPGMPQASPGQIDSFIDEYRPTPDPFVPDTTLFSDRTLGINDSPNRGNYMAGEEPGGSVGFLSGNADQIGLDVNAAQAYQPRPQQGPAGPLTGSARMDQIRAKITELEGLQGSPGTAFMKTPVYQRAIDEGIRSVNQGAANAGFLYSGRRGEALKDIGQGVQANFYQNYMSILERMANPVSSTNLSNIGINQAATMGSNIQQGQQRSNEYNLMGTEARGQATSDIVGGITSGVGAYLNRKQPTPAPAAAAPSPNFQFNPEPQYQ